MPHRPSPPFRADQYERYKRHLALPEFGAEAQQKLLASRVLLIGAGGLGCPLAQYLAAAGVGTLGLVDFDVVDASNLQRQVLYGTADVGRPKAEVARERILALNPDVKVEVHQVRLASDNALGILGEYDVVVDGTDNFPTRYLSNDACVLLGKPNVHGSIFRFEGQATVFDARRGPCYRCLYPEPPPPGSVPSCAEGGVLGVLPGIVALIQATETIKLLAGIGEPLIGRLLQYDALEMSFQEFRLRKDPACPVCGEHPTVTELIDYDRFCGFSPEQPMNQGQGPAELTPTELKQRLDAGESFTLIDVREPFEWDISNLEPYGARLLPLDEVVERASELDPSQNIVLYCRSGARSAGAIRQLQRQGFEKLWNLKGGINAWADQVDPSLAKY
jgi:sulfur-carrier protein adenylyltransferase/sulfurtransferase